MPHQQKERQYRLSTTCLSQNQGQIAPCVLLFPSWVSVVPFLCCLCHRKTGNESCSNLGTSVFPGSPKKHMFHVKMDVILISEVFSSGGNQPVLRKSLCICLAQAGVLGSVGISGSISLSRWWLLCVGCHAVRWRQGSPCPSRYPKPCSRVCTSGKTRQRNTDMPSGPASHGG